MERKYITVEEEETYFQEIYDSTIGDVERAMFLTPNYLSDISDVSDVSENTNIKDDMIKTFSIETHIIDKMASIDIASGGTLPLPQKGESVNVRMLSTPRKIGRIYMTRCVIHGREVDLQYYIPILSTMAKSIFVELQKAKMPVDDSLKMIVGRVFTIVGREWAGAPKELWKIDDLTRRPTAPRVLVVALRLDLEAKIQTNNIETRLERLEHIHSGQLEVEQTQNGLMTF